MRLTCPNCGAQYEVDDALIPPEGRDVQCSACGHAWFVVPEPDEAAILPAAAPVSPEPAPAAARGAAVPAPAPPPRSASRPSAPPPSAPRPAAPRPAARAAAAPAAAAAEAEDEDEAEAAPATAEPRRRSLDPSVAEVLREEAEREARARRTPAAAPIETQPDLGLPPAERTRPAAPAAAPRRERLPDIEEINSTLRPDRERPAPRRAPPAAAAAPAPRTGGFRRGFALMLLLALLPAAAYLLAPRLAQLVPAAAEPLAAYVGAVDAARLWIRGLAAQLAGTG